MATAFCNTEFRLCVCEHAVTICNTAFRLCVCEHAVVHPSRDAAEAAWAEQTGQTPQEFGRVFDAVDSVHAYS